MTPEPEHMETTQAFKCPEGLADLVGKVAFDLDISKSEVIRSCILIGLPLVRDIRGVERLRLEDIRNVGNVSKNKVEQR